MKSLTRYPSLMSERFFDDFQKHLNRWAHLDSEDSTVETSQWMPSVDIKEEPDQFVIVADVPGVEPKDIELSMEDSVLTIKGEKKEEISDSTENYVRTERSTGIFYRRFSLPSGVDAEGIRAEGKHGVLKISIPKQEKAKPRKIEIQH